MAYVKKHKLKPKNSSSGHSRTETLQVANTHGKYKKPTGSILKLAKDCDFKVRLCMEVDGVEFKLTGLLKQETATQSKLKFRELIWHFKNY